MRDFDYWYPWSPAAYQRDTMHLTDMQDLIYRRLIDFYMGQSKGPIEDNDQALANIARVPLSVFKENSAVIRAFFKKCNKNKNPAASGWLMLTRCEGILSDQRERSEKRSGAGRKGAQEKAKKNKGILASGKQNAGTRQYNTEIDTVVSISPATPKQEIQTAFRMFNEMAERVGIPKAQSLNKSRAGKIAARLRDCGGIDGWAIALEKVAASDFCAGRRSDFKASLDFILQESSFTKLMEGNYDNGKGNAAGANGRKQSIDPGMEGFSRAAAKHADARRGRPLEAGADAPGDLFAERNRKDGAF